MEIDRGMQPNCSELVIRLNTHSKDEALEKLREIGIDEYLVKNRYDFEERQKNWDGETNEQKVTPVKDIPKKVRKAYETWNKGKDGEAYQKALKTLEEYGINPGSDSFALLDDTRQVVDAWLTNYPYSDDAELGIMYHQHCTVQGFPLLKKISEHVGEPVEAHDGGSIQYYEAFLEGRDPFEGEE